MQATPDLIFVVEILIGGLGALALFFFGYTINELKKSIDNMLGDVKKLEARVSKLEADRADSLGFRRTIEVMFEKVQEQHNVLMSEVREIKDWVRQKDADILEFYKQFGSKLKGDGRS